MQGAGVKATVFLGGGRITSALAAGFRLAGYDQPIVVHDRHPHKLKRLKQLYEITAQPDPHSAVRQAKLLIVAVRPDSLRELLQEIGEVDHPLHAVSLVAGVPLAGLRGKLGKHVLWSRAMPSPACRSGKGLTALAFDRRVSASQKKEVRNLFARVGPVIEVPESKFDVFTVTYSCSHGYHALATLAGAGQGLGLDRKTALTAAAHALADGILGWREGDISLDELLREAATPGGIAAAVMKSMDAAGYQRAVRKGLAAGLKRTRRNARLI
jgi:pyrroline-5-carboxylate reductase